MKLSFVVWKMSQYVQYRTEQLLEDAVLNSKKPLFWLSKAIDIVSSKFSTVRCVMVMRPMLGVRLL